MQKCMNSAISRTKAFSSLVTSARKLAGAAGEKSDISALTKLMEKQDPIEPQYLCEERK